MAREDGTLLEGCLSMYPQAIPGGQRLLESALSDVRKGVTRCLSKCDPPEQQQLAVVGVQFSPRWQTMFASADLRFAFLSFSLRLRYSSIRFAFQSWRNEHASNVRSPWMIHIVPQVPSSSLHGCQATWLWGGLNKPPALAVTKNTKETALCS